MIRASATAWMPLIKTTLGNDFRSEYLWDYWDVDLGLMFNVIHETEYLSSLDAV